MQPGQAYRHHLLKMDIGCDVYKQADRSINPTPKSVQHMWTQWRESEHGGLDNTSLFDAINKYAEMIWEENCEADNEGNFFNDNCLGPVKKTEEPNVMSSCNITDEADTKTEENISKKISMYAEELLKVVNKFGGKNTIGIIDKKIAKLKAIKSTNQLDSFLRNSSVTRRAGRRKMPCQPTSVSR